ncbi:hypothetical protein [Sphingomonas adhaesiva]
MQKTATPRLSTDRDVVRLGKAKDLTKAAFTGVRLEMIPGRRYDHGG